MAEVVPTEVSRSAGWATSCDPVSLLELDPDLAAGIPECDLELARHALAGPSHTHAPGPLDVDALCRGGAELGVLIAEGAVARRLDLVDRHSTAIFGPGDVIGTLPADALLDVPVTWHTLQRTTMMVLDGRFTLAARRWPSLMLELHRRLLAQSHRGAVHAAISQLPRVELRLLAFLWHLAERWGRVTAYGVDVRLDLTHEALGQLVGAQRPTVTLALGELARDGAVTRTVNRTWLLANESRELLRTVDAAAARPDWRHSAPARSLP